MFNTNHQNRHPNPPQRAKSRRRPAPPSSRESQRLSRDGGPAVALETAFLTRGLPTGSRLEAARRMSAAVRAQGAEPHFIGVMKGRPVLGLEPPQLEELVRADTKLSTRDLAVAAARGTTGGTTVAAAIFLAHRAGLTVAATGGIGGVHPGPGAPDVSADVIELARTPVVLVCSGPKAITDAEATLERLETLGVMVIGYGTDELPAFWSRESGLALELRADSPEEIAGIWREARALEVPGALLVCVPPPRQETLSRAESDAAVSQALADLAAQGIRGAEVTPFLLARIAELTEGRSLRANLALLEYNASVAGAIAAVIG